MLLHTEYSLLSLLKDQEGVVHHHGLFKARSRGGSKIFDRVNPIYDEKIVYSLKRGACVTKESLSAHPLLKWKLNTF